MPKWYDIRIIKPMEIIEVNVGQTFNIFEATEYKKWKAPYMIYSYKYLKANSGFWDSKLNLKDLGGGRFRYDSETGDITNESIISVLIMESNDIQRLNKANLNYTDVFKSTNNWQTYLKLNKHNTKYGILDRNDMYFDSSYGCYKTPLTYNLSKIKKCFMIYEDIQYLFGSPIISWETAIDNSDDTFCVTVNQVSPNENNVTEYTDTENMDVPSDSSYMCVSAVQDNVSDPISIYMDGNFKSSYNYSIRQPYYSNWYFYSYITPFIKIPKGTKTIDVKVRLGSFTATFYSYDEMSDTFPIECNFKLFYIYE